jgi:two-component system invasion response regulator UvrY
MALTAALVCDSDMTCSGTKEMLAHAPDIALVERFASITALDDYLQQVSLDVALLDDALPPSDWLDGIAHLAASYPALRIIALGNRPDTAHVQMVLERGAHGFICKGEPQLRDTLIQGIQWVCHTEKVYLSPGVAALCYSQPVAAKPVRLGPYEKQALTLLAEGRTAQQIAEFRGCKDAEPVYAACRRARAKLGAKTTEEAIHIAIKLGLIRPFDHHD